MTLEENEKREKTGFSLSDFSLTTETNGFIRKQLPQNSLDQLGLEIPLTLAEVKTVAKDYKPWKLYM